MDRSRERRGDLPKKRLGQHFLKDPNTARIVAAGVGAGDVVLEIGPGYGALTTVLAERARLVHAVEVDPDVIPALRSAVAPYGNVVIHEADALTFDYSALAPAPDRMAANLPYNAASPLLLRLLEEADSLRLLRFMVQLEVARRMDARRRTKDYGSYAVLAQLLAEVKVVHKVSPLVFEPPPRVWSSVVEMRIREKPEGYEGIKDLTLSAFRSRRKRLTNNLPVEEREVTREALLSMGHSAAARAEELSPDDFAELARRIGRIE